MTMANTRPVDPTKVSNRKCEHCEFWGGWNNPCCQLSHEKKEYYHRCKKFIWRKDGVYTQPPVDYAVPPKTTKTAGPKAAAVARKLASQMWGKPDHQRKLAEECFDILSKSKLSDRMLSRRNSAQLKSNI